MTIIFVTSELELIQPIYNNNQNEIMKNKKITDIIYNLKGNSFFSPP